MNIDGFAGFCLQMCNDFTQYTHQMQPMFDQYPQMQYQMYPQMQGVYGDMTQGIQQNYYGMLYNIQNYPAMNGTWPNDVFNSASMYPYAGQSYAYPQSWMWYAPQGAPPVPGINNQPEVNPERALLLRNARATLTSLTLRHPQLGVLLDDQSMQATVQFSGRSERIALSSQRSETVAKYLEDQVARFLRGEGGGTNSSDSSPESSSTMTGIPETIAINRPFTMTVTPPAAPVTITWGSGALLQRPFVINERGVMSPAGSAPFTVTRTGGALLITVTGAGMYAFQVGTQTVRRTVTAPTENIITLPTTPAEAGKPMTVTVAPPNAVLTIMAGRSSMKINADGTLEGFGIIKDVTRSGNSITFTPQNAGEHMLSIPGSPDYKLTVRTAPTENIITLPTTPVEAGKPMTVTVAPPNAVLNIVFGSSGINVGVDGALVGVSDIISGVHRTGGSITFTPKAAGEYALTVPGGPLQKVRVAAARLEERTPTAFENMVRAATGLPAGVAIDSVAGRTVTLLFARLKRDVAIAEGVVTQDAITAALVQSSQELQRRKTFEDAWATVALARGITKSHPSYTVARLVKPGVTQVVDINIDPAPSKDHAGPLLQAMYENSIRAAGEMLNPPEAPAMTFEVAILSAKLPEGMRRSVDGRNVTLSYCGVEKVFAIATPDSTATTRLEAAAQAFQAEVHAAQAKAFTDAVEGIVLPTGMKRVIAGRIVTLSLGGKDKRVDLSGVPIAGLAARLREAIASFVPESAGLKRLNELLGKIRTVAESNYGTGGIDLIKNLPTMLDGPDGINPTYEALRKGDPTFRLAFDEITFRYTPSHRIIWNNDRTKLTLLTSPFADRANPYHNIYARYDHPLPDRTDPSISIQPRELLPKLDGQTDANCTFRVSPAVATDHKFFFDVPGETGGTERWMIWDMGWREEEWSGYNSIFSIVRIGPNGKPDPVYSGTMYDKDIFLRTFKDSAVNNIAFKPGWGTSLLRGIARSRNEGRSEERDDADMTHFDLERGGRSRVAVLNFSQGNNEFNTSLTANRDLYVALRARGYNAVPRRGVRVNEHGIPVGADGNVLPDMAIRVGNNPKETFRKHIKESVDDGATTVLMTVIAHGYDSICFKDAGGSWSYMTYAELFGIFQEFPTTKFVLMGIFCHGAWGGGQHDNFRRILHENRMEGRVTIITETKPYRLNWSSNELQTYIVRNLFEGRTFGDAYRRADRSERERSRGTLNPEVHRSGTNPTYTAGLESERFGPSNPLT